MADMRELSGSYIVNSDMKLHGIFIEILIVACL